MADSSSTASLDEANNSSHSCVDETVIPSPFTDRPDRISITIHRSDVDSSFGIVMDETGLIVDCKESGLLILSSPTMPNENLLKINDKVESINGIAWVEEFLCELVNATGSLVFVIRTSAPLDNISNGDEAKEEGSCVSSAAASANKQWIMNQAVIVLPESFEGEHGIQLRQGRSNSLWIYRIVSDIWNFSVLQPNQRILAIGSTNAPNVRDCAYELLNSMPRLLSITTLGRKPGSWTLRKAAVSIGGSALFGVGAVLMVTPLHPVGHAMAVGGLSVLGTEYEGPRKAMQYPRKAFDYTRQKLARRLSSNEVPNQTEEQQSK